MGFLPYVREHSHIRSPYEINSQSSGIGTQAQIRTPQYLVRAAIIEEFEAVAENLNFPSSDPIRQSHLDFWKVQKQIYGMRNITAHKYGVTDVNFYIIWKALSGPLQTIVLSDVEALIQEISAKCRVHVPYVITCTIHLCCQRGPTFELQQLERRKFPCWIEAEALKIRNNVISISVSR